jgi:MFS family permease
MSTNAATGDAVAPAVSYRWVILFICWLAFLLSFVDRLTWANVAVSVGDSLGLPVAALGVFVTAFYVGYVLCNGLGGFASDWIGGRLTLTFSMLALGTCTFLFGWTTSITMGLIIQALMGLSAGADYASCIKLIVAWFDRGSRGKAMGLFLIASSLGVVTTNALVPTLAALIGWRGVYHMLGAITIGVGIVAYLVLRDRPTASAAPISVAPSLGPLLLQGPVSCDPENCSTPTAGATREEIHHVQQTIDPTSAAAPCTYAGRNRKSKRACGRCHAARDQQARVRRRGRRPPI